MRVTSAYQQLKGQAFSSAVKISTTAFVLFLFNACASTYQIHSTPESAMVSYIDPGSQKQVYLGTTPLSYSKSGLPSDRAFLLVLTKEGYQPQEVPMSATDESKTTVRVNLKPDLLAGTKRSSKEVNEVIARLFKAQRLIYERKMHAAIIELDQVTKDFPEIAQAFVLKGAAYFLLDETDSATTAWKAALKLDHNNIELLNFLEEKGIKLSGLDSSISTEAKR